MRLPVSKGGIMHSELNICEEEGYRRGFDQGMYIVIKMLKEGKNLKQIEAMKEKIHRWRYNGKLGPKNDIRINPPVNF